MIIHKREQMPAPVQTPVIGAELTQERVAYLKHIHAVKA